FRSHSRLLCFAIVFFSYLSSPPQLSSLSLHDALPIFVYPLLGSHVSPRAGWMRRREPPPRGAAASRISRGRSAPARSDRRRGARDRKSTRLNSSHVSISYAVFCLKKKKENSEKASNRR